jgi:hypothetical protein
MNALLGQGTLDSRLASVQRGRACGLSGRLARRPRKRCRPLELRALFGTGCCCREKKDHEQGLFALVHGMDFHGESKTAMGWTNPLPRLDSNPYSGWNQTWNSRRIMALSLVVNKLSARVAALLVAGLAGLGCTFRTGLDLPGGKANDGRRAADAAASYGGDVSADQSVMGGDLADGGSDSADGTSIVGNCATADDCLPVLDYRGGFECWAPKAASWEDVRRDTCLVPWKPDPQCTTSAPPPGCPGGPVAVNHSCIVSTCSTAMACTEGKCSFGSVSQCSKADAGTIDCEALRTTLGNALAAAQRCYPLQAPSVCTVSLVDTCGCDVPYDISGPCATAVQSAFNDWQNANCPVVDCDKSCVTTTAAGAICVPSAAGTVGTCAWK